MTQTDFPRSPDTGLVRVRGSGPFLSRALILPDRVGAHLLGDHEPSAVLDSCLLAPQALDLPGTDQVSAHWQSGAPLVWVHGPQGSAGLAMAAGAATRHDLDVIAIDLTRASASDQPDLLEAAILEAVLRGGVLMVAGLPGDEPSGLLHRPAWSFWSTWAAGDPEPSDSGRGDGLC